MIVSKTPFRMSFVGGGSDMSAYYRDSMGAVISTTIDKYMYVVVNPNFDGRFRISYSRTEDVDKPQEIQHPLVREAMKVVGIDRGIDISSLADIPSKGSGLGSSSSYTVGLLNALYAYKNKYVTKEILASQACEIEIEKCGEPIGKQDQYAAAYGGLNLIKFNSDETVSVEPLIYSPVIFRSLQDSILVFYTGITRNTSSVLADQSANFQNQATKALAKRMVELAFELKVEIEAGRIESVGSILHENWCLKIQLAKNISSSNIDILYDRAIKAGASGGKLLGAGNGGFMMFFAKTEYHSSIIEALSELRHIPIQFDQNGTQIVFYQPTYK